MLGEQIKLLRQERNLSQVDLASKLNITKQSVSNWENNNILPSIDMLVKLSECFSVSTDFLLGLNDKRYLEVSRLTPKELTHIQLLIEDIAAARSAEL